MNSTQEYIILNIKLKGPLSVSELAKSSGITKEGMRQHLEKLEKEGFVKSEAVAKGVGRPTILYDLEHKGQNRFPDSHAGLAIQLLDSIRRILGQDALGKVVEDKQRSDLDKYMNALAGSVTLEDRLENLTEIRSNEGYMAEWEKGTDGYYFIENNCPICAAASKCSLFCQAELQNIQKLLGDKLLVERTSHAIIGDRRCSYKIQEK